MGAARELGYGQFYGHTADAMEVEGFSFSEVAHRADLRVPVHTHTDPHFVVIIAGAYITTARPRTEICPLGSVIFNPPGTTHADRFQSAPGLFFTLSIRPERYAALSDAGVVINDSVRWDKGEATWLATRMYREFSQRDSLSPTVLEGVALELLATTARQDRFTRGSAPGWVRSAVELIQDRCGSPLTVREIAAEVGVHPYHLCRSFRRFVGLTPGEFIRSCRITRATDLLRQSRLSIAAVASQCGYADQSQLTRSFRRATGTTPARLRRDYGLNSGEPK